MTVRAPGTVAAQRGGRDEHASRPHDSAYTGADRNAARGSGLHGPPPRAFAVQLSQAPRIVTPQSRPAAAQDPFVEDTDDTVHPEPLGPDDPLAPLPFNPYKGNRGVTRAWHALKNSLNGVRVAIREESAFRQELTLAAILLPCGVFVPVAPVERVALLASVLLVLIVELLNSSVEAAIDRISLERHELSKRAKDFGSAAVMLALFVCLMTWALLVGPLAWHWTARML
jgi:diacylglycerol kinase (ATP)